MIAERRGLSWTAAGSMGTGGIVGITLPPRTSDDASSPSSWFLFFLPSRPAKGERNSSRPAAPALQSLARFTTTCPRRRRRRRRLRLRWRWQPQRRRRRRRRKRGCDPRILNDVGTRGDGALLAGLDDASDTSTHVRTSTNLGRWLVLCLILFTVYPRLTFL